MSNYLPRLFHFASFRQAMTLTVNTVTFKSESLKVKGQDRSVTLWFLSTAVLKTTLFSAPAFFKKRRQGTSPLPHCHNFPNSLYLFPTIFSAMEVLLCYMGTEPAHFALSPFTHVSGLTT